MLLSLLKTLLSDLKNVPLLPIWHRGTCGTAQPGSGPIAAVASHEPHGKELLFPNSYGILVFPLPSHPSAFSHGLRRDKPLAVPWKLKKEKGKYTQTMEIPVFPFLLKHRGFQAYGKHPHQPKRHFLLCFSAVGMPSGSCCLTHHHPQDAVAGAGGVEVTGTQGQAQGHLDNARAGGDGLWDPSMGPAPCSQVSTSAEPTSSHPTWLQPGQSFHFTPQILIFLNVASCALREFLTDVWTCYR